MPTRIAALLAMQKAAALGLRVSVVSRKGMLIALRGWGEHDTDPGVLGHGWMEHVAPEDVDRIMAWFAERRNSGPILYTLPGPPASRVCLVKEEVSDYWLVVGEETPLEGSSSPFEPSSGHLDLIG